MPISTRAGNEVKILGGSVERDEVTFLIKHIDHPFTATTEQLRATGGRMEIEEAIESANNDNA